MKFNLAEVKAILKNKLGSLYGRAEMVLGDYGERLSFDVLNVLLHASDQGEEKIKEVLNLLEKHFKEHLMYQHPDIRGTVYSSIGVNKTQTFFLEVCKEILGLQNGP